MAEKLAIDGGNPVRTRSFPRWPVFDAREERLVLEVLHSGDWGVLSGEKVHTFERQFADFQQARFGLCVTSGTAALEIALRALAVGPGDEVIVPAYTFVATATAVLAVGARPVFADIDPDTFNIDLARVEAAITPRTKALMPVHFAGQPVDMDTIMGLAARHSLRVIEDACQAWGAAWRGHRVGSIGDLGAFSFQASKNISAGEGGIVLTNDPDLYDVCWSLHNCGRTRDGAWYFHERVGGNERMTEWQGAVLLAQLERLPEHTARRDANARTLSAALDGVEGLSPLPLTPGVTQHARHLFIIRYDPAAFGGRSRDDFLAAWRAEGITVCSQGYKTLVETPAIRRAIREQFGLADLPECPAARWAEERGVWIAQYALLGEQRDMDDIVSAAHKIQRAWAS